MDQYHRNCYPHDKRTEYNFSSWSKKELVKFARNPPNDIEARDWKNLAIELAKR